MSSVLEVILKTRDQLTPGFTAAEGKFMQFKRKISAEWSSLLRVQNLVLGGAAALAAKSTLDATIRLEALTNRMNAAAGSAGVGRDMMRFVTEEAARMGTALEQSANGFAGFSAAALRANMPLSTVKKVFVDITETATALHLSREKVGLVFIALEQMASKGVVSMEELRRQLADSLPGAVNIGAKAMGMTTKAFMEAVSSGKVMANDFLPKFAAQVRKELGGSFEDATHSIQASINRMENSKFLLQAAIGEIFKGDAITAMNALTSAMNNLRENIGYLRAAFQIAATPVVILWNAFQILADTVTAGSMQIYQVGKIVWIGLATMIDTVIDSVFALGDAYSALQRGDFGGAWDELKAGAANIGQNIKDLTASAGDGLRSIQAIGNEWAQSTNKNVEDVANQLVKMVFAVQDAGRKVDAALPSVAPSSGGGGDNGDNSFMTQEQRIKEMQAHYDDIDKIMNSLFQKEQTYLKKMEDQRFESAQIAEQARIDLIKDGSEKEIALLNAKYAKMRKDYANNAEALANIDRAYSMEKERINQQTSQRVFDLTTNLTQGLIDLGFAAVNATRSQGKQQQTIAAAQAIIQGALAGAMAIAKVWQSAKDWKEGLIESIAIGAGIAAQTIGIVHQIKEQSFATGGAASPGYARVGEHGSEIVRFTQPAYIYNAPTSADMTRASVSANRKEQSQPVIFQLKDYTGRLVQEFWARLRTGEGREFIRDLKGMMATA
jgi:tape measure domain-containing protein